MCGTEEPAKNRFTSPAQKRGTIPGTKELRARNSEEPPVFADLSDIYPPLPKVGVPRCILWRGTRSGNRGTKFRAVRHTREPKVLRKFVGAWQARFLGTPLPQSPASTRISEVLRFVGNQKPKGTPNAYTQNYFRLKANGTNSIARVRH